MGLFEKSKNITDTELRIVVQESSDPAEALRRHILSLEEASRQLRSSEQFLDRQRKWLESSAERKLSLAEEWARRAEAAARGQRDDLARHALLRKKDLLRSMGEDRRQLEGLAPQIDETERRLGEIRRKIAKARAVRERLFGHESGAVEGEAEAKPGPKTPQAEHESDTDRAEVEREIDAELDELKRKLNAGE